MAEKAILKWWIKSMLFLVIYGIVLFLLAGEAKWIFAWTYLASVLLTILANSLMIDPALLAERAKLQEETKKWDVFLSVFVAILGPFLTLAVSGLDRRLGWSRFNKPLFQVAALLVFLFGAILGVLSMAANKFFASTVRIQTEREHKVISSGPYRFIRHPGYISGIIASLMTPLVLGSLLAIIPAILVASGYILRTALEDKVLHNELSGYSEYAQKVRYKLIPYVY
ncbi:isoprenylcysteine carboxylmethyltransferase family protein [Spirochaetota bacterium]